MAKILIIEKEPILAEMYKDKFEQEHFFTKITSNYQQGLEVAKEEKPDLILIDIQRPTPNDPDFLNELKENKQLSTIPVVILSNYEEPRNLQKTFPQIKDFFLNTQFTPSQLVERIKPYLKQ